MYKILLFYIVAISTVSASCESIFPEGDVTAYIKGIDDSFIPNICRANIKIVDTYGGNTEKKSEGFFVRKGNNTVFIQSKPESKKNFALLRMGDVFYTRLANTGRVIITSATDNSRGGETSNLDLTRFNTTDDYYINYVGTESIEKIECYKFEMTAKNRKLAYGFVDYWIDIKKRLPVKKDFFSLSKKVLKTCYIYDIAIENDRVCSIKMKYVDVLKPSENSHVTIADINIIRNIPDVLFTKEYLESGRPYK
ncbi:MAG: outer membrane lipoprotein-sorting protein [Spirochaetales bacterium]|nr:outer membrane lipoprotein-sorting protein [Spirochaetales bacterium]